MTKTPTFNPVTNRDANASEINDAIQSVADQFEKTLFRDGETPNQMEADLDMDSNDILNVDTLGAENIVLDGTPITPAVDINISYENRDDLVDIVALGATWPLGTIVSDSTLLYVSVPVVVTTIPDLPGLEPIGRVFVGHWGVEGTDVGTGAYMATPTVDESSTIQTAMDWCLSNSKNLYGDLGRSYGISSQIVWGANGSVVPNGMLTLVNFQYVWIGAADTSITKTATDADDWVFSNEAALVVGGSDGSTPGKYLVSVKGLRGDGQRIKNVVQFRQMFSATCEYHAERGLDYEVRIGEENDDSLNTTNCDYKGFSRHYAFQERSDGTFGADDGTGWYGLTGRTSVGHLIESSDVQISSTGNTGLHSLLLRESFNVEMSQCKWWNGPGPGNPSGFVTAIITKSAGNYALRGGQVQDGAIKIYSGNGVVDSVRFIQYTHSPIQLITDTADSTWAQFKIVNCIADFSGTVINLGTIGSGSWKFFEGTFFGNNNFQGTPLTIQDRQWNIGDVRDPFHTRGELEFALDTLGWEPSSGRTIQIGFLTFVGAPGSTTIGDLPGVEVSGVAYPDHYEENTTPGTTDMGPAINQALQSHAVVKLRSETTYFSSVPIVHTGVSTSLEGEGAKLSNLSFGDFSEPAIQLQPSNVLDNVFRGNNRLANINILGNSHNSSDRWAIRALKQEALKVDNVRWSGFSYGLDLAGGQLSHFTRIGAFGSGLGSALSDSCQIQIRSAPNTSGSQRNFTCSFSEFELGGSSSKNIRDIIRVKQCDGATFDSGYISFGERSLLSLEAEANHNVTALSFDQVYFDGVSKTTGTPTGVRIPASVPSAGVVSATFGSGCFIGNLTQRIIDAGSADNIRSLVFSAMNMSNANSSVGSIKGVTGSSGSRIKFIGTTIRDCNGGLSLTDGRTLTMKGVTVTDVFGGSPCVDIQGAYSTKEVSIATSGVAVAISDTSTVSGSDVFYEWSHSDTFTPTLTIGGSSAGISYSAQSGSYERVRGLVTVTARVALSSKGGLTGDVVLRGLPFTAAGSTSAPISVRVGTNTSFNSGVSGLSGDVILSTTNVRLSKNGGFGEVSLDGADITDTFDVRISVTYEI